MKKGEQAVIKATGQIVEIAFVSEGLPNNFYLALTLNGLTVRDENGEIAEFYRDDLDYTNEQKYEMQQESYEHDMMQQIEPPYHHLG